ncbi:MAG: DUF6884 domain-containing protein, partial [Halovenus sp.]
SDYEDDLAPVIEEADDLSGGTKNRPLRYVGETWTLCPQSVSGCRAKSHLAVTRGSCSRGGTYFRLTMDGQGMEIGLVSCTKAKAGSASTPRKLYEPSDKTLNNASVEEQRVWSHTILEQLRERDLLVEGNTLVIHAGVSCYEELLPLLDDEPVEVKVPTEGLRMGETLSWYNERIYVRRRRLAWRRLVELGDS